MCQLKNEGGKWNVHKKMQKFNKFDIVSNTAKFVEISEKIKISIKSSVELSKSFTYSEPTAVDTQLTKNSNSVVISNFVFREPLQRLKKEEESDEIGQELVERLSLLNIGNSDESSNQLDSLHEVVSNDGNEYTQTASIHLDSTNELEELENFSALTDEEDNIDASNIHLDVSIKEESEDYEASFSGNDSIGTSSICLDCVKEEYVVTSYDLNNMSQSSDYRIDNCEEQNLEIIVATTDAVDNIQTRTFDCSMEQDVQSEGASNQHNNILQTSSFQTDSFAGQNVENNENSTDNNVEAFNLSPDSSTEEIALNLHTNIVQTPAIQMDNCQERNDESTTDDNHQTSPSPDCFMEEDSKNDKNSNHPNFIVETPALQMNNSTERNAENNEVTIDGNDHIPTPNLHPDCSMEQDAQNIDVSSRHNQSCNRSHDIQTDCELKQNVENDEDVTDAGDDDDDDDDRPTVDIDPNTQITHLDVDSSKKDPPTQYQQDSQPLPFLIKHIHNITWPNQEEVCYAPVIHLFGQTCSTVMVYGVVTSLNVENGGLTQRFVIDDGSGSIKVVWKIDHRNSGQFSSFFSFLFNLKFNTKFYFIF